VSFPKFCKECGYCNGKRLEKSFKTRCKIAYDAGVVDAEKNYFNKSKKTSNTIEKLDRSKR